MRMVALSTSVLFLPIIPSASFPLSNYQIFRLIHPVQTCSANLEFAWSDCRPVDLHIT